MRALGRQLPVVVVGRPVPPIDVDVVRAADDVGVAQAVDHLVGLGHRRIVHVDGGRGVIAAARRGGYESAMRRHGLSEQLRVVPGDLTEESGARVARELLDAGDPLTAVVTYNDHSAVGVLDALLRRGVDVPGEVSVVGFDDSPLARLAHIDLTTVSQESAELTRHAVAAVVDRLDGGRTGSREVVVPPRLVVRGTTAPPPGVDRTDFDRTNG
jgi:DNA-binding LacI/PurR family transcriptional regulator